MKGDFVLLKEKDNQFLTVVEKGTPMGELFRQYWTPVLLADELPAPDCPPVQFKVLGEELVAFRDTNNKVGVLSAFCPHRGASLFYGRNEECGIRCVYHGWKFDVDGNCTDMPSEPPESNFKHKLKAQSFPTEEYGGLIWIYMGTKEEIPSLPKFEWAVVPETHRYVAKIHVECNFMQSMEGDIDSSHSAFLHSNKQGKIESGGAKIFVNEKLRTFSFKDKSPRFFTKDTDYGILIGARREASAEEYYWRITQWLMPTYSIIPKEPGGTMQCNARIPIDNHTHMFFRIMWNPHRAISAEELYDYKYGGVVFPELIPGTFRPKANKDNHYLIDRAAQKSLTSTGIKGIPTQDTAMTESMGLIANREIEHLGTSDTAIIRARKRLMDSAKQLIDGKKPYSSQKGDVYFVRSTAITLDKEVAFDEGAKKYLEGSWGNKSMSEGMS